MEDIKFLAYLASDGLTVRDANDAVEILTAHIEQLESLATIGSLVEKTKIKWESGIDGKLQLTAEVEEKCMQKQLLMSLPENLRKLAKARALKKWLENAISYMDAVTTSYTLNLDGSYNNIYDVYQAISESHVNKYMRELLFGMVPEPPKIEEVKDDIITGDDYFAALAANDLARYYAAQAAAATIGDFIHPEGNYATARIDLVNKIDNPCEISAGINTATILRRIPTVDVDEVDKMYFLLQGQQRDHQKDVNSVIYKSEDAINASEQQYYQKRQKIEGENMAKVSEYNDKVNQLIKNINNQASQLCIAIPTKAKALLDEIVSVSENK